MKLAPATVSIALLFSGAGAFAQSANSTKSTIEAYGARLNNPADTSAQLNSRRINNRINNRIESRIATRIERYRVGSAADPVAAFARIDRGSAARAFDQATAAGKQGVLRPTIVPQARIEPNEENGTTPLRR